MAGIRLPTLTMARIVWPRVLDITPEILHEGLSAAGYRVPGAWGRQDHTALQRRYTLDPGTGALTDKQTGRRVPDSGPDLSIASVDGVTWRALPWGRIVHCDVVRTLRRDGTATWGVERQDRAWGSDYSATEPKPRWDAVREHVLRWWLDATTEMLFGAEDAIDRYVCRARDRALATPLAHRGHQVIAGASFAALQRLSPGADRRFPATKLLTTTGTLDIRSVAEAQAFLAAVAVRKNRIESARNVMRDRARVAGAAMRDPNGGRPATEAEEARLNARTAALHAVDDMLNEAALYDGFARIVAELA